MEESTFERESEMFMPPGYPRALGPARWQAHMRVFIPYAVRDMPEITDYPPLREDVRRLAEKYGVRAVQAMVTQLALEADRG